jgi:caa(3)-type oxidase subunit IV
MEMEHTASSTETEHSESVTPTPHATHPNYIGVFVLLGVLTAVEIGASAALNASPAKIPMLLLLAAGKAVLVALYYMHLRFDSRIFSFFFVMAIFVLAIPFALVLLATEASHIGNISAQVVSTPRPRPTQAPNVQPPPVNAPPASFTTTASEFKFDPNTLTVKPGQTVNVTLKNGGTIQHTFVLQETNTKLIADAGQSTTGSFKAPGPGTYQFFCDIPGHKDAGMEGTLVVQ